MPGTGAETAAFVPESSYNTTPGTPTYYNVGTNVRFETVEINRNLLRLALPGDVEDADAIAQRLDGQLNVSFVMQNDDFHRIVFNDGNTGFTNGNAASAEWYLAVEQPDGTVDERQIQGWAPLVMEVSYNGTTDAVRVTLQGFYAEEDLNTSVTPGTIENNSTGDEVPGHGADLKIAGSTVSKLQSATVRIEGISRPQFGSTSPIVQDAVLGDINSSATMAGVFEGSTHLEYAYGSSGATSIENSVNSQSVSLALDHDGTTIADYSFSSGKPRNYNWQDLVARGNDLTEPTDWWASGVTASDPTA